MAVIVRKISRLAGSLAALCMAFFLCGVLPVQAEGAGGTTPAAKKKIALVQFDVANSLHVDDISNIYDGLPSMLAQRLEVSGDFLAVHTGRSIPPETGEAQREAITQIAGENGAQFLISGMVVNAGTNQEKGFLGTSLGGYKKRHIEVELAVHDGLTGARLLTRRLDEEAQGEVRVGNDKPFGSSIFLETELGRALNRLLDLAVKDIRTALEKVSFSAHIIRAEGKKVFLDAGSDALLKPGDRLVVYARDATPVVGLKGSVLGVADRAVDMLTLTHVQPQFSSGELPEEAAKLGIKAGSVARIDPDEQRALTAKQIAAQQMAKAEQEAKSEAARVKAEQAAQAESARAKAEQAAKDEAVRIKAEKKAQAEARAKAEAEAKAAKLKARQEARAARISAAQEARAREQVREKARAAAEAKAEKEAKAKEQAAAKPKAGAAPKSAKAKTAQQPQTRMEVRAVAVEDLEREAAEAKKAEAEAVADAPPEKKPGVPLKLKQIKP